MESELDASKARELEALARVDEIMKDFSSETQTLRSKVTELSRALREAEDSRLNVGQTAKMLESQLQQEERAWQSKSWDLQKQMQAAEERLEMERQVVAAAVSKTQSVMQQLRQLYLDMRQFEVVLKDEQYQHKQLQRQLYTLKMEESKRDDMLMRTANELGSLKVEQEYLKKQNEVLVDQIGSSDTDAGLEGFARGVEKCQAELKAQAERTREAVQEMAQMKLDVSAKDKLLKEMEDAMHKLREQVCVCLSVCVSVH